MQLTGTVREGSGAATGFFKEGRYDQDYGFNPYPGTLNLEVGEEAVDNLLRDDPEQMFKIGQEIWLWEAKIEDVHVWVSLPTLTTSDHIEIIAPLRLRRWFNVEDGDELTVTFTGPTDGRDFSRPYDSIQPIAGGALVAGKAYHEIPGVDGPVYRGGTEKRVDHFVDYIPVEGTGLDLGCSVGGLSIALAERGATMFGHDYDASAVRIGNEIAHERELPVILRLTDMATEKGWSSVIDDALECDFAVWMSNWMWIAKQAGRKEARSYLLELSGIVPVLVFETAEDDGSMAGSVGLRNADDVEQMLRGNTGYTNFENIGHPDAGWHPRSVFICS